MAKLKKLLCLLGIWTGVLALCVGIGLSLLVVSAMIPSSAVRDNLVQSSEYLKDSPSINPPGRLLRDNYSDALMLNITAHIDESRPLNSVLENRLHLYQENQEYSLFCYIQRGGDGMRQSSYFRCWNGYIVFLRPLLTIVDYEKIRYINYVLIGALFLYLVNLVRKKFRKPVVLAFLAAMLYADIFFVPQSMQYVTNFYIAIIASILVLKCSVICRNAWLLSSFFVVIGSATSFSDLIAAPLITMGFPLMFVLLLHEDRVRAYQIRTVAMVATAWFFGYAGMWVSKWFLCAALTDLEVLSVVLERLATRSVGALPIDFEICVMSAVWFLPNWGKLWWAFVCFCLIGIILGYIIKLRRDNRLAFSRWLVFLFVALLPCVWMMIAFNHTCCHMFMAHRMWGISIFAFLVFVIKITTGKRLCK